MDWAAEGLGMETDSAAAAAARLYPVRGVADEREEIRKSARHVVRSRRTNEWKNGRMGGVRSVLVGGQSCSTASGHVRNLCLCMDNAINLKEVPSSTGYFPCCARKRMELNKNDWLTDGWYERRRANGRQQSTKLFSVEEFPSKASLIFTECQSAPDDLGWSCTALNRHTLPQNKSRSTSCNTDHCTKRQVRKCDGLSTVSVYLKFE